MLPLRFALMNNFFCYGLTERSCDMFEIQAGWALREFDWLNIFSSAYEQIYSDLEDPGLWELTNNRMKMSIAVQEQAWRENCGNPSKNLAFPRHEITVNITRDLNFGKKNWDQRIHRWSSFFLLFFFYSLFNVDLQYLQY